MTAAVAGTKRKHLSCEECWQQQSPHVLLAAHFECQCPLPICARCIITRSHGHQLLLCSGCGKPVRRIVLLQTHAAYRDLAKKFCARNGPRKGQAQRICKACMRPKSVWARHLLCAKDGDARVCYECATSKTLPWRCLACDAALDEKRVSPAQFFIQK